MTKPNLNDVATRIRYMLDGGKVTYPEEKNMYYFYSEGHFRLFDTRDSYCMLVASSFLFTDKSKNWEPYEEPKTEEDLRREFAERWLNNMDSYIYPSDKALEYAKLLFDTFELRKK